MKLDTYRLGRSLRPAQRGMTILEVMVALAISAFSISGIVYAYVFSITSAERFSFSQAASERAVERMEQTRCAQWVTSTTPGIDQLQATNFPAENVSLDIMGDGVTVSYGTNLTTITDISITPALRKIHVDCIWAFGITQTLMTNSVEMIRSPR